MQEDMQDDEYTGQGGSYLLDPATGRRTRVEQPTLGSSRCLHPDAQAVPAAPAAAVDLARIAGAGAAEVIAAVGTLDTAQLAQLAALESGGKARVTVLDAIAAAAAAL